MSFPHRTAFFDRENNEIVPPESGLANFHSNNGQDVYDVLNERRCGAKYIPLASTGLEDSEGNEIFEGHILRCDAIGLDDYAKVDLVVEWIGCSFMVGPDPEEIHERGIHGCWPLTAWNDHGETVGHTLTDPEMVPDCFDVEEYFRLDE